MNANPLPDVVSGLVIFVALGTGLLMLATAILVEALVLRWLKWASGWVCLADSAMANLASAVLGCVLVAALASHLARASTLFLLGVVWPGSFALSWIAESCVISLVRRRPFKKVLRPFLAANLASYGLILALLIVRFGLGV
jgi:hypothetical protein